MSAGELCLTSLKQAVEKATFFTSDSRLTDDCTIFVALSGSNVDGHDFVHDALNKDVVACITQKDVGIEDPRIIKCEDTSKAHRLLAKLFREKFQGKVIAVGGSNGKTSTKDFLYTLLAKKFSVIKTLHSQNGYLGIPATFERLRPGLDCAVIEVGIDGPGDMQSHLDIVKPDIGILTSIGTEHLRQLKNLEGVFEEESKLVEFCASNGGPSFVPANDPFLSKLSKQKNVTLCPDDPLEIDSRFHLEQIQGIARRNASLAITCALKVGMSLDEILTQLPSLKLPEGRGALNRVSGQEYVVEDFYNANLSSMTAATTQAAIKAKDLNLPLYFVLGDMLDLGDESEKSHQTLLESLKPTPYQHLILVGKNMAKAQESVKLSKVTLFDSHKELQLEISKLIKKPYFTLFKGSRGMKLELALEELKGSNQRAL